MTARPIRVLLVEDHLLFCDAMSSLLRRHADIDVVSAAHDARTALATAELVALDVVVMDISLPDLNGIEATRRLIAQRPNVAVVALSGHDDTSYVNAMLEAGASGFVVKTDAADELADAIRAAARARRVQ